tara:strand:- start:191 stop:670 length:480 start_codon:yes stop_codon:yes gene_type:complete
MKSGLKDPLLFFRLMDKLKNIVQSHLSEGIKLMDLIYNARSDYVKITIDSQYDIQINQTTKIANQIRNDDDFLLLFPNGCRIEVGTPGVGTNLVEKFQYRKNIGRKIFIKYKNDDDIIATDSVQLIDVENDGLKVNKNDRDHLILFENIISAKVRVSFD